MAIPQEIKVIPVGFLFAEMGEGAQWAFPSWGPGPGQGIDVHGGSSQTLAGEIGLSEFENVFVIAWICPETMKSNPGTLRETNFEAAVTRFGFSWKFGRKSKRNKGGKCVLG